VLRIWRFVTLLLVSLGFAPELGSAGKTAGCVAALVLVGLVWRRRVLAMCVLGAVLFAAGAGVTLLHADANLALVLWTGGAALVIASVVDETPGERRRTAPWREAVPGRAAPGEVAGRAPGQPSVPA
jgi:hypothetical protein